MNNSKKILVDLDALDNNISAGTFKENGILLDNKYIQYNREIETSDDLNNYIEPGMYKCTKNSIAETLENCPTITAFSLLIESHAGIKQTLSTYSITYPKLYIRNKYLNDWGEWFEVYNTSDPITIPESLKNPYQIKFSDSTSYDGSAELTVDYSTVGALGADETAVSAEKLNTNAGSSSQPVYFNNGIPVACGGNAYKIGAYGAAGLGFYDHLGVVFSVSGSSTLNVLPGIQFDGITSTVFNLYTPESFKNPYLIKFSDGTSYDGSAELTVDYSTVGALAVDGTAVRATYAVNAGTAVRAGELTTTVAGNALQPVYFSNGVPVACGFDISNYANVDSIPESLKNPYQIKFSDGISVTASYDGSAELTVTHLNIGALGAYETAIRAISAGKLYTNANTGNALQPVYFSNGIPVACDGNAHLFSYKEYGSDNYMSITKPNIRFSASGKCRLFIDGDNYNTDLTFYVPETPAASETVTGLVNTTTQTFAGAKTFSTQITSPNFYKSSDRNLKENINSISEENLEKVKYINPVEYNFIGKDNQEYGYIAQDVEEIYPSIISTDEDGIKSIDYIQLLVIQNAHLMKRIEDLENKINKLCQY